MAAPTPPLALLGAGLVLLAVAIAAVGELLRRIVARWAPLLAVREPVGRAVLDLYLGGAVFYLLAVLPLGAFSLETVLGVLVVTLAGWVFLIGRRRRSSAPTPPPTLRRALPVAVAAASALVVLAVELVALEGVGTGNTYDSSLLTTYVALLGMHHTLPLTFAPVSSVVIAYPQGTSAWVGAIDPFLFGPTDQSLSPFPVLRVELAILLVVGAALCLLPSVRERVGRPLVRLLVAGVVVLVAMLALSVLDRAGVPGLHFFSVLWSPDEEAILLFELYALLAAVPIALAAREALSPGAPSRVARTDRPRPTPSPWLAGLIAVALVAPGGVITGTLLPGQLHAQYSSYGNVSQADLDLLEWAGGHLPVNATVLVAPGSAAEFLPAYLPTARLVEPMAGGYREGPADYWTVVDELTNATLDARGTAAMGALGVGFVAVTGVNNILFPAFSPAPLEQAGWTALFHEGDAYLFAVPP